MTAPHREENGYKFYILPLCWSCESVSLMLECRIMENYITRNLRALFTPTIANSTHHRCLADHGYKPVDSCRFHQKFYHYHRRSRRHRLAKKKKSVQLSRPHWVGYVSAFAFFFFTKTGIGNLIKRCLASGCFDLSRLEILCLMFLYFQLRSLETWACSLSKIGQGLDRKSSLSF